MLKCYHYLMSDHLKKQINAIYLYTFFSGMMFWYGIEQLFLEEIGDGVFARGVTLAVFSLTMFITNIPAGALSDVWGRVRSLKLGIASMALSLIILAQAPNVFIYSIGAILFALFWSFDEGAKEAFVYDSLYDEGQTKRYQRILGRIYASLLIGAATANFSSGLIADALSLRANYWLSLIPCALAFYYIRKLDEPDHHKQVGKKILSQLDDAGRAISRNSVLLAVIVAQTMIYVASSASGEFAQPAVVEHTDSAVMLGLSWGVLGLLMAAGNLFGHHIRRIFVFILLLIASMVSFYVLRAEWYSIIFLFLFVAGMEAVGIRGEGAIQNNTQSHLRATLSSIPGSASMLVITGLSLWIGGASGSVAWRIFIVSMPLLCLVFLLWWPIRSHIPRD